MAVRRQVHLWQTQKLRRVRPVHFHCRVAITPVILGLIGRGGPEAPQRPTLAHDWNQAVTMLIRHPNPDRLATSHVQVRAL